MALEKLGKIPSLVRKVGQSASKAQPFYSPIDEAISRITQGKGTGAQMLAELLKTKGVAKELKDRPAIKKTLEAAKDTKVTKADVERLAAENPVASVQETTIGAPYKTGELDRLLDQWAAQNSGPTADAINRGETFFATRQLAEEAGDTDVVNLIDRVDSEAKFQKYTIPGGENYREVLIKLPSKSSQNYQSSHFDEPNILAHARVIDRVGPNGEKILHVEEVQSDWHQAGRKKGYKEKPFTKQDEKRFQDIYSRHINGEGLTPEEVQELQALNVSRETHYEGVPDAPFKQNWHELVMKRLLDDAARNGYDKVVITPGAEQAKRYDLSRHVNEIAVPMVNENGVRSVRIDSVDGTSIKLMVDQNGVVTGYGSGSNQFTGKSLDEVIGKDMADKVMNAAPDTKFSGGNLQVGGEGMKGFYDQIIPSYLNDYGKKYGARVGTYNLPDPEVHHIPTIADIERGGVEMFGRADLTPEETLQVENAFRAQRSAETAIPLHSFDITPQMREEITTKGQPLYQVAPPVAIGAGAAMQEEEPTEYAGGGIIKKAGQIIGKAAQSSGMAPPVTATKNLTTLQDFHTSLGDRIRQGVGEKQNLIESMPFKYDKGQRVFTEDSARKNRLPYEILDRTLYGNQPMRADHPVLGPGMGAVIKDPDTGKSMRTPYEAGYRVRSEGPEGWQEYVLPETAIKGDVEMAGGGAVRKALKAVLPKGQQPVLPAEESAENLQKFLGNSRIRDILYHATPKSFAAFKPGGDNPKISGPAIWLTPDAKNQPAAHNIGSRSQEFREGTNVMPVYAQARSPLMLDDELSLRWAQEVYANGSREFPELLAPQWVQELKKEGYDSIIFADPLKIGQQHEVMMFEPNRIKSAIGNRGTYDIEEADINKAKGGQVSKDAMWIALQNKQLRKKHGN